MIIILKLEQCILSNDIMDYFIVSQGKTTIPSVNDGEEFELTDVRHRRNIFFFVYFLFGFFFIVKIVLKIKTTPIGTKYVMPILSQIVTSVAKWHRCFFYFFFIVVCRM